MPQGTRNLNGRGTDAARPAVHQQAFTRTQFAPLKDIGPDREKGLRQAGCLYQAQPLGDGQAVTGVYYTILGITPACSQCANLISHLTTARLRVSAHNLTRHLQTRPLGRVCGEWVSAYTSVNVATVCTGRGRLF